MAAGKINLQKASGGVTAITGVDGIGNTELVLPESGTVARTSDINTAGVELKTIANGTATFTATTNNINLTGIGIGVEIGDVIQISGADDAKNNSEFTIEVITDANNVIVNQAHANKGTAKNVANRSGDTNVTVKLLSKYYNATIGLGQGWVNMLSVRSVGSTYLNNIQRAINLAIKGTNQASGFFIDGIEIIVLPSSPSITLSQLIPKGSSYNYTSGTIVSWFELR